jgi:hypothetical protein
MHEYIKSQLRVPQASGHVHQELKVSYTRSLRAHTPGVQGLIHQELKASYTSSLRSHTLVHVCSRMIKSALIAP